MRLSSQRGFTLVELLVAMVIGGIVMTAALTMLTRAQVAERDIADRSDATIRGRYALEQTIRPLRSLSCLSDGTTPIISASNDEISFYADLDNDVLNDPEKWRLSAVRSVAGALTGIREQRWIGLATPVAATTAANQDRTIVDGISARLNADNSEKPLFSYSAYVDDTSEVPTALAAGTVPAADLKRIAQIDVGFSSAPASNRRGGRDVSSQEESSVYVDTLRRNANQPFYDCIG